MEQATTRHDLKIFGKGNATGGLFNEVAINGQGDVEGDIDSLRFTTNGDATINGSLKATEGNVFGEATIKGALEADRFKVFGTIGTGANTSVKDLTIDGTATIRGSLAGESVSLRGSITINGDCNAETFECKGAFTIDGLLNAGRIELTLYGPARAREIGGGTIRIRKEGGTLANVVKAVLSRWDKQQKLVVDSIEGDDLSLEHTRAKVVRGTNVHIGEGCEIDLVEYKGNLDKTNDAIVKEAKKV